MAERYWFCPRCNAQRTITEQQHSGRDTIACACGHAETRDYRKPRPVPPDRDDMTLGEMLRASREW